MLEVEEKRTFSMGMSAFAIFFIFSLLDGEEVEKDSFFEKNSLYSIMFCTCSLTL